MNFANVSWSIFSLFCATGKWHLSLASNFDLTQIVTDEWGDLLLSVGETEADKRCSDSKISICSRRMPCRLSIDDCLGYRCRNRHWDRRARANNEGKGAVAVRSCAEKDKRANMREKAPLSSPWNGSSMSIVLNVMNGSAQIDLTLLQLPRGYISTSCSMMIVFPA